MSISTNPLEKHNLGLATEVCSFCFPTGVTAFPLAHAFVSLQIDMETGKEVKDQLASAALD